jgi:hypothetical protein
MIKTTRAAIGAAVLLTSAAAAQQVQVRAIALSGQPAPGLPGVTFDVLAEPRISNSGAIAFWATLSGAGITNDNDGSVWVDRGNGLALAYQEGSPAFGTTGTIAGINGVDLNESGLVAFAASIFEAATPNAPTNIAYFAETAPGTMSLLVREAATTQNLSTLLPLNAAGLSAWSTGTSIVLSSGTSITATTPVPDAPPPPPPTLFRRFSEPVLSDGGALVFRASYGVDTTTANWSYGLFSTRSGQLAALARTGGAAAGLPPSTTFRELGSASALAQDGAAVIWARVQGPAFNNAPDTGIFREQNGQLVPLVMGGDTVPGAGGATFAKFAPRVAVTSSGGVIFRAFLSGATTGVDNSGLFYAQAGQPVHTIIRRDQPLPGMPDCSVVNVLGEPHAGGASKIAFTAFMRGPGITSGEEHALFAGDLRLGPRMILRQGMPIAIPGSANKVIRSISFDQESEETGRSQMRGNVLVVYLTFTDRTSGLFDVTLPCAADFDGDGDPGTDADIEAFFACIAGNCCDTCASPDFDADGDVATDRDIEAFFRVLAGGGC